ADIFSHCLSDLLRCSMVIVAGATLIPIIVGMYWKKANAKGATAGIIFGGATTIVAQVLDSEYAVIIGSIVSLVALVLVSLVTTGGVEQSKLFQFNAVPKKDYGLLLGVIVFFVLFLIGLTQLAVWPFLIILTIIGMTIALFMMIYYVLPKRE